MTIHSNPDQSKHLETARMRLFDVWIDFVNLRAEDYSDNSRIPTMVCVFSQNQLGSQSTIKVELVVNILHILFLQRFGTAQEDAYRRDLTINRYLSEHFHFYYILYV